MSENQLVFSLAIFGQSRAGKTALLSSYFGHLSSLPNKKEHFYQLSANTSSTNKLTKMYFSLKNNVFPEGTVDGENYDFNVMVNDKEQACIRWFDYPGAWWEENQISEELIEVRKQTCTQLCEADLAFLLIDAARYNPSIAHHERCIYLSSLFRNFSCEINKLKQYTKQSPKVWVLALSKADLAGENYTAEQFYQDIQAHADEEFAAIKESIGGNFGEKFLLLSAAYSPDGKTANAQRTRGLHAIAPLALLEFIKNELAKIQTSMGDLGDPDSWWKKKLRDLLTELSTENIERLKKVVPKKYHLILDILLLLNLKEILIDLYTKNIAEQRAEVEVLAKNGSSYQAALNALMLDLRRAKDKQDYYEIEA